MLILRWILAVGVIVIAAIAGTVSATTYFCYDDYSSSNGCNACQPVSIGDGTYEKCGYENGSSVCNGPDLNGVRRMCQQNDSNCPGQRLVYSSYGECDASGEPIESYSNCNGRIYPLAVTLELAPPVGQSCDPI